MKIICTSDRKYYDLFLVLYKSAMLNSPDIEFVLRSINNRDVLPLPNVEYIFDDVDISTIRNKLSVDGVLLEDTISSGVTQNKSKISGARFLFSDFMCYCTNIKYKTVYDTLVNGDEDVLYMDVDAIIRKDLARLVHIINNNDITILGTKTDNKYRPITEPGGYLYHCGIMGFCNTPRVIEFSKFLWDYVNSDMFNWDANVTGFYKGIQTHNLKIHNMDEQFKDEGNVNGNIIKFREDSYIWCGAGSRKYTSDQYITECEKYNKITK